jgi:integrase/recombinase XerD
MAAYSEALAGKPVQRLTRAPGTASAAILRYLASDAFKALRSPETRRVHRATLERFAAKYGARPFALLDRKGVELILAEQKPGAARNLRNVLRRMCRWAVPEKLIDKDPTEGVRVKLPESDGWHTMTDEERAAFEQRWPIGTKDRAIYAVLYYTALRVSDAAKVGPQHVSGGQLTIRQQKNRFLLKQPVHPDMLAAIKSANMPLGMAFLMTRFGRPYSAKGLANRFKAACIAAGLPHCSAHTVRKGTATMIADRHKSEFEIAAFLGDKSLRMAELYTRKRDTAKLARSAATAFETETGTELSTMPQEGDRKARK